MKKNNHEFYSKVDTDRLEKEKSYIHNHRNELGACPYCNANIQDRIVSIYAELIKSLLTVYRYCGTERIHEFEMKQIRHLLKRNEYARFGDLVRFGGLVYKTEKSHYGLNMDRCKQFFAGTYTIPVQIILNQITNEIVASTYRAVNDIPGILQMLDEYGMYDHKKVLSVPVLSNKNNLPSVENYQKTLF